mmetsp:Transcript_53197/g.99774  ORF Transcript_53197/g.99774 Transcript_53197/m.99774 type:complete len:397 (-) Transcript_53197:16-1206(-)
MAPKKATATKFLVRAKGEGFWTQKAGEEEKTGEFRALVNTDLAEVVINIGPDFVEDWNPAPLQSYSFRYLRGGSHLRISFELQKPPGCKGELELNVFGGFAGRLEGAGGPGAGKITGTGTVEEAPDHVNEIPRPTKALAEKLQNEPRAVRWEAPDCVKNGVVALVGIGGPSKSGKSSLAKALVECLKECRREATIVEQSRYERCVGTYNCSAGCDEQMFENPSAIAWLDLAKAVSAAADRVSTAGSVEVPSIVIVEGSLVFHIPQLCQAFHKRIFLRTSRSEVLRRRQAIATLAEPFVEHVFWPMHLQYGQPQAAWDDIRVEDGAEGCPVPEALLSEALGVLDIVPPSREPLIQEVPAEEVSPAPEATPAQETAPASSDPPSSEPREGPADEIPAT